MTEDEQRLVADLQNHPGWALLKGLTIEWRAAYYKNLADSLYNGTTPLAEADLDFKRGYFKALARLFNEPGFNQKTIERGLNRKERDQA